MKETSIESRKSGEEVVQRLDSIEKLIVNLNETVFNSNRICIHANRLNNLEKLMMLLKSKIDVLKDNFLGSSDVKINEKYPLTEKLFNIKENDSKDIHEPKESDIKGCNKVVGEQCEKTLKSPSNSPFLNVKCDIVHSHHKRKSDFKKDDITSKSTKLGIPKNLKNISFGEPTLPRGLKTLRDSPINGKVQQSSKKKEKFAPSKEMSNVHSRSKGPLEGEDILASNESFSKSNTSIENDEVPTLLYEKYLQHLSAEEAEICNLVYKYDKLCNIVYCNQGSGLYWTASDVKCLFPDLRINDFLIDLVAFDMNLEAIKKGTNKLYLPSFFQYVLAGYDVYSNEKPPGGMAFNIKFLEDYIPKDTRPIEQVYIPILENMGGRSYMLDRHWFLVVIHLTQKKCYLLDSLNTTIERKNLVSESLAKASGRALSGLHIFKIFKDVASFDIEVCDTMKQMNGHDCGMFVIKYMEKDQISKWREIRYTTEEMRVERLKYLAKLLRSEFNYRDDPSNTVKDIVKVV